MRLSNTLYYSDLYYCVRIWCLPCDSRFKEFLWLSVHLSGGCFLPLQRCDISHILSLLLWPLHTSPNQCFELQKTLLSLGKHWTGNIPSGCLPHNSMWRTNVRHPWVQGKFFHANLIRECLVGFLSREIWTTAYGRLEYFPLRACVAFHHRVRQVISYKFTALLLSINLPCIIKGIPLDKSVCAWDVQ